ncbi:unnamed protein product [Blepharisma stoltei]|uniref:Uncharacterized protein n=1 Tax=Blepharisma stoltei TaxID=1481888 RepID=A0AAU9IVD3_9CILI|nr:unnamed protein product [Blepharisma stoltei]
MELRDLAAMMYDISLIQSGFFVSDPRDFYQKVQWMIAQDIGIDSKAPYKEPDVEVEMPQDEDVESLDE